MFSTAAKWTLVLMVLTLSSCNLFDDCNGFAEARLNDKDIIRGTKNVYMEEGIRAQVNNEPRDNDYFYDFVVYDLPPGLDYEQVGRDVFIFGTPTQAGRYFFQVDVIVTPRSQDMELLCEDRAIRDYALRIDE